MSYNTRRSAGYAQQQQANPQPVGNIGQRRAQVGNVTSNFVSGGQLKSEPKPAGVVQQPQQQQQQQNVPMQQPQVRQQTVQQASGIQFKNQAQAQQLVQPNKPETAAPQIVQQQQQQQQLAQPLTPQQQQLAAQQLQQQQLIQQQVKDEINVTPMDTTEAKKKNFWSTRGTRVIGSKISRKEKIRRRNVKLSKMLQPKNAVMILNELVKNTSYMVEELPAKFDGNQFKATVVYDDIEHSGYGRSKIQAKNTAAEAALKNYVKTNKLTEVKKDDEGNEKMDVTEDDTNQSPLPWQHVASFALYKLFCSWGEDPNIVKNQTQNFATEDKQQENKPAKKMPENPENINPLMLINQMLPQAHFEEIGKTGNPPNVVFSFKCNVNGESFIGTGPNKKAAKKMAAFGACSKVLEINYPPDTFTPTPF